MDNLSNELNKLKIDKSQREQPPSRRGAILIVLLLLLIGGAFAGFYFMRRPADLPTVESSVRAKEDIVPNSGVDGDRLRHRAP